ncbi:MAG: putative manganese-dependent inorganic diphosphatase [Thermodesulfobacteriota bacterium]|nr:MAG: putative manganese-dependent inorganic diphosphatase [Thermodesulfobacteriota bacterium]
MGKEIVYVVGHKNPDTDSVCSSIALAELKKAGGMENVTAARAGDLNPQTSFILDSLKIQPPKFLPDVYPRARDIMSGNLITVSEETPLKDVMDIMREERIRFIPVLNHGSRPVGFLTLMDLAMRYIGEFEGGGFSEVYTSFENITGTLNGTTLLDFLGGSHKTFSVYVGAMEEESFAAILGSRRPDECVVIVGDRVDIQRKTVSLGAGVLIISGGFSVDPEILDAAREKGVSVAVSPYDSATTALLVRLSTPAGSICNRDLVKVSPDEVVDDLRYKLAKTTGILVIDGEDALQGIITKSSFLKPSRVNLILVDHNELSQAVDGADRVNIIEVIDHHRIGGFNTSQPIPFICDPVGSTSCLIAELYRASGVPIKKDIAGLLLGGVLSDTVMLKSPTTTERDAAMVKWLEEKSGLDAMTFGAEIFGATSSIRKRGAAAVVRGDHKVFTVKGKSFGIGQVETIGFDEFYEEKDSLLAEVSKVRDDMRLEFSALLVTDIVMGTSLLLAVGAKEIIHNLGYPEVDENVFNLRGVISRKKQVVPHIIGIFNDIY